MSNFEKSSNEIFSRTGAALWFLSSFAFFVSNSFCTWASIVLSSIFSKSSSAGFNCNPSGNMSVRPNTFQSTICIFNMLRSFFAEKGKKGSKAMARFAEICNAKFNIVATRFMSVFASFQGSVSAKYLFPIRARFIASFSASLNR